MPREVCLVVESRLSRCARGAVSADEELACEVDTSSGDVAMGRQAEGRRERPREVTRMAAQQLAGLCERHGAGKSRLEKVAETAGKAMVAKRPIGVVGA